MHPGRMEAASREVARGEVVPREIDRSIAALKLETMGVSIDVLTDEQVAYLASWEEGT